MSHEYVDRNQGGLPHQIKSLEAKMVCFLLRVGLVCMCGGWSLAVQNAASQDSGHCLSAWSLQSTLSARCL